MSGARMIRTAPGTHRCCDHAGRLAALAQRPIEVGALIALALRHGEGSRAEIAQRVEDMLACGLLIDSEERS